MQVGGQGIRTIEGEDIYVEIRADGEPVSEKFKATEFRQDLLDSGACVNGTCGFTQSLWGLISSYEPHEISVFAQDFSTGEWVRLSDSPKTLTCRTYDIYAYNPVTGSKKQLTNLREADEYNPSWSLDGSKVAYDVVKNGEQTGINVTNLKTLVSTPLAGAQNGGNDAVFSPNSKWVAFDRVPAGDSSIYLVPAAGGTRKLVRGDATSADWAPNGKRLVFRQPSDGSIRTIAVDGGTGGQTAVVPEGSNPVWSPDGNWIAYEKDGDIWKVAVNLLGVKRGNPIRLTSGPEMENNPSWSANSKTIAFQSGVKYRR